MRKIFSILFLVICLLSALRLSAQQKDPVGPEQGSLIIVGGGSLGPEIWARFIELAGGAQARIVVIPTANEDSAIATGKSFEKDLLQNLGVQNVVVLHTRSREVANTDSFVAPLKKATGIWFTGGRQWRLADSYLNTRAHAAFNDLLKRGGVIGGTSAGATIQGSFLLRGDTKGNNILVGDHVQGLDFIHQVAIDQHVMRRNRLFDLVDIIKARPELLGIGIDENTAIVVNKNKLQVIGNSYVAIYEANSAKPFFLLGKGQWFDLKDRKVIAPAGANP